MVTRRRALTIVFGALPATWLAGPTASILGLGIETMFSGEWALIPVGSFLICWGGAGLYGTYSLWAVGFGCTSDTVLKGLTAGLLAVSPLAGMYVLFAIASAGWFLPAAALVLAPAITALLWRDELREQRHRSAVNNWVY